MVGQWIGSWFAANWGSLLIVLLLSWGVIALIAFAPKWFVWLWKLTGWNVTAERAPNAAFEAAARKLLLETESNRLIATVQSKNATPVAPQ